MKNNFVGKVTEDEKNEMLTLYERKLGIDELVGTLNSNLLPAEENNQLLEKMILEAGKVKKASQDWWNNMQQKYQWEIVQGHNWFIEFDTCSIYLN